MWGNRNNGSVKKTKQSRAARINLNSTMPILPSSPMMSVSVRPRVQDRSMESSRQDRSIVSPAGPLISSPFMPQIKRALGLEPTSQSPYR